jgi:hypothetical protein
MKIVSATGELSHHLHQLPPESALKSPLVFFPIPAIFVCEGHNPRFELLKRSKRFPQHPSSMQFTCSGRLGSVARISTILLTLITFLTLNQALSQTTRETFAFSGPCCSCAKPRIDSVLKTIPGFIASQWVPESGQLTVDFDKAKTSLITIQLELSVRGYNAGDFSHTPSMGMSPCCGQVKPPVQKPIVTNVTTPTQKTSPQKLPVQTTPVKTPPVQTPPVKTPLVTNPDEEDEFLDEDANDGMFDLEEDDPTDDLLDEEVEEEILPDEEDDLPDDE